MTGKEVISRKLSFSYPSLRAPVRQKAGAFECQRGGAAACLYFLVVGTSKKTNCGLLRFARNDKFQIRHCEPPLHEWQEAFGSQKGGAAVCLYSLVLGTSKKKNCRLPRHFDKADNISVSTKHNDKTSRNDRPVIHSPPCPPLKRD